jgi:hypothetical protein
MIIGTKQWRCVDLSIDESNARDIRETNDGAGDDAIDSRKTVSQTSNALQGFGRVDARFLVADADQHNVAQLETRRSLVAFRELLQTRRNEGAAVESELNPRDKGEGANGNYAGARDDDARIPDRKSQNLSYDKHHSDL